MTAVRHERELWAAWQAQRWRDPPLRSTLGPLQVVYRGRWSGGDGPDYRDAIIATPTGELLRGDVEVHRRASGWFAHGHDADPAYGSVVLHVVLNDDGPAARRHDGTSVPTCWLTDQLLPEQPAASLGPRFYRPITAEQAPALVSTLRQLGELRFRDKAARFAGELAVVPPADVLWGGLLDALGYARNRAPFAELARRVPWTRLEARLLGRPASERSVILAAWLLGTAGLLPAGREELAQRWRGWRDRLGEAAEVPPRWECRRVRPENHPRRRVLAAAELAARALPSGLMSYLLAPFQVRDAGAPRPAALEAPLRLTWQPEVAALVGTPATGEDVSALIGADRAGEMVVNVVLPFAYAWADCFGQSWLADCALDAFRRYRPLGGNEITRHLSREFGLAGRRDVRLGACHQQGLLQVDRWHRAGAFDRLLEHGLLDLIETPLQLALFPA